MRLRSSVVVVPSASVDEGEPLANTGRLPRLRLIEDVLRRRELRCPPDHWRRAAVVWGKSTFWAQIAVLDPPGFACRTRPPAPRHRRAGAAPQNPLMESSKALSSVMASLSWRMRAASASLPAHSRTDA